jgi:zinc protease
MAQRLKPSLSPGREADLPVFEHRLGNGLDVLILQRRGSPVVVVDLFYPVGSFDEPPGLSGLAHFVEHMLFKGTERYPKGQIDRLVTAAAGQCNAETGEDSTHYWFTFPADRWDLALAIEADRMCHARFDPREVELERRVIAEERARELGSPQGRLDQHHLAVTYLRHPYRNPILGWPDDAARIGVDDLTDFYRRHYRPDGAVLVLVGDVDQHRAVDRIADVFEGIAAGRAARARPSVVEPRQAGRRDFSLVESDGVARALLGWRTVPRGHDDVAALDVLSDLLTCGRRSRLWHLMVETSGLATWVEAAHATAQRGGQFLIQLESDPSATRAAIERCILDELRRLSDHGPTPDELARSRRRLESAWRWERDEPVALASGLGHAALWGGWRTWLAEHRASLAVTAQDVRRVAAAYLDEQSLTCGWTCPSASEGAPADFVTAAPGHRSQNPPGPHRRGESPNGSPGSPSLPIVPAPVSPILPGGVSRLADHRPRRVALENGLRLVFERRQGTGVVALELYTDAGILREAKPGLAALTGRLLEEGTASRDAEAIARAIEDVGGSLEVGATGASVRVCAEDLALSLDVLADMVMHPAFPEEAIGRVARRMAAELRGDLDDPAFRAETSFRGLVYGSHPMGRDPRGGLRDLGRLTREDVVEHHRRHVVPEGTILAIAGDFDARRLVRLVRGAFDGWPRRASGRPPLTPVPRPGRPRVRRVQHPSDQVHLLLGHLGVVRNHSDYEALLVLDHVFGSGPGFSDRLGRIVRDEMGLVYAIGGGITDSADILPGMFRVYAGTMPEEADRVVATITDQVRAMRSGAFSDEEVERARRYLAGAWVFDYQGVEQRAERLLESERWGRPLEEARTWPDRIAAVTAEEVRKAARSHLAPEALCRVELGPVRRRGQRSRAECA